LKIMSYRGTVKNGVVVLEPGAQLQEGSTVEVVAIEPASKPLAPATGDLPAFGLWRDRRDIPDSAKASLDLRRQMEHRQK
jgi:hypothetical protein